GEDSAREYFAALEENDVVMVAGNSVSRDRVSDGELPVGFTDTDDANIAIRKGHSVRMVFPDSDGMGTLLIPNTVALIKGARHLIEGKQLIDYLLSPEVESELAHSPSAQIPVRASVSRPDQVVSLDSMTIMSVEWEGVVDVLELSTRYVHELFIQ
ncbi:MAG: extracellular solute-binding protein, partial [Candidatus Zixiibacteriota bacterium]